jgi:hypothetical protein
VKVFGGGVEECEDQACTVGVPLSISKPACPFANGRRVFAHEALESRRCSEEQTRRIDLIRSRRGMDMYVENIPRWEFLDFVDIDIDERIGEQLLVDIGDWQQLWRIRYITNRARGELDLWSDVVILQQLLDVREFNLGFWLC